jgi:hypothetical protein
VQSWLVVTGTWLDYVSIQLGIIIPTDELHHFSEGLKPPTRNNHGHVIKKND